MKLRFVLVLNNSMSFFKINITLLYIMDSCIHSYMYMCLSCSSLLLHPLPHPLTTQEDNVLELELDDIEEEEELEELEEGHCHDVTQDVSDKTRASSSLISDEEETERPKSRKQRVVYV